MINPFFRKSIFISLLGHATAFSFLTFSFGRQLPDLNHGSISFWGGVLNPYDFIAKSHDRARTDIKKAFMTPPASMLPQEKIDNGEKMELGYFKKPQASLPLETEKALFMETDTKDFLLAKKRESVVMLYPKLPYHFSLYFKDRQVVHIELDYSVISKDKTNALILRRKISSGNLEADLLCMRYLNLYLSMQQDRFTPNKWHTVKIELEPKK